MKKTYYTWEQFDEDCDKLAKWAEELQFENIYGIPRSGLMVAVRLSHILNIPLITDEHEIDFERTLVVDDIMYTGHTVSELRKHVGDFGVATLARFKQGPEPDYYGRNLSGWVIFPWERDYVRPKAQRRKVKGSIRFALDDSVLDGTKTYKKGLA